MNEGDRLKRILVLCLVVLMINCCGEVVEGVIQQIMESLINLTPLVWLDNSFPGMVVILRLIEFHGHMVSN